MTPVPPGWYRDPSGWGQQAPLAPVVPPTPPPPRRGFTGFVSAHPVITVFVAAFVAAYMGLGFVFALQGKWLAVLGAAELAVLVGAPAALVMLGLRLRRLLENRARRRRYEAELAARADVQHQAVLRGDLDAGVFGEFRPPQLPPPSLVDADQMRQPAWQPDMPGASG